MNENPYEPPKTEVRRDYRQRQEGAFRVGYLVAGGLGALAGFLFMRANGINHFDFANDPDAYDPIVGAVTGLAIYAFFDWRLSFRTARQIPFGERAVSAAFSTLIVVACIAILGFGCWFAALLVFFTA